MKRKICVISGGRADYGLLKPVMIAIQASKHFSLQIIATGSHFSDIFGNTADVFELDGFAIDSSIKILSKSDSARDIALALSKAIEGFSSAFERLKPDLIVVLGDRYEILGAVNTALLFRIPVAHLCGGDVTEGAFDESIRHSITKCSHLHFATNQEAADRIRQMGENPNYIYNVGSSGLDNIVQKHDWMTRAEWLESIGLSSFEKNILVTFHPATLELEPPLKQLDELLNVLKQLANTGIIITGSNADSEGAILTKAVENFAAKHDNIVFHTSLGMERYLNTMKYVDMVVGNSSSGLYEAPSFAVPTINIGTRQQGRLRSNSVIDCSTEKKSILAAINQGFLMDCSKTKNPYGDGKTSAKIIDVLESIGEYKALLKKPFFKQ